MAKTYLDSGFKFFKMAFLVSLFSLLSGFMLVGCSSDSPGDVVRSYYENIEDGDVKDIVKLLHSKDNSEKEIKKAEEKLTMVMPMIQKDIKDKGGIKEIKILEENIEDDKALVKFRVIYKDGSEKDEKFKLIKANGDWKLLAK